MSVERRRSRMNLSCSARMVLLMVVMDEAEDDRMVMGIRVLVKEEEIVMGKWWVSFSTSSCVMVSSGNLANPE